MTYLALCRHCRIASKQSVMVIPVAIGTTKHAAVDGTPAKNQMLHITKESLHNNLQSLPCT